MVQCKAYSSELKIVPVSFREACAFIKRYHRHHQPPQGHKFSIAVAIEEKIVGVAVTGRPVARALDNGWTLEVTRLCTDGTPNACSKLYAACWRVCKEMGYRQLVTYILDSEKGTSLKAAGWKCLGKAGGGSWNTPGRPRIDKSQIQTRMKFSVGHE